MVIQSQFMQVAFFLEQFINRHSLLFFFFPLSRSLSLPPSHFHIFFFICFHIQRNPISGISSAAARVKWTQQKLIYLIFKWKLQRQLQSTQTDSHTLIPQFIMPYSIQSLNSSLPAVKCQRWTHCHSTTQLISSGPNYFFFVFFFFLIISTALSRTCSMESKLKKTNGWRFFIWQISTDPIIRCIICDVS